MTIFESSPTHYSALGNKTLFVCTVSHLQFLFFIYFQKSFIIQKTCMIIDNAL